MKSLILAVGAGILGSIETLAQADNRVITLSKANGNPLKVEDKYFGNVYVRNGDGGWSYIKVGGWGDVYGSTIKWNPAKLPKIVSKAWLLLSRYGNNTNTTDLNYYAMATPWSEYDGVDYFAAGLSAYSYPSSGGDVFALEASAGPAYGKAVLDITDMYKTLLINPTYNKGVLILPQRTRNRFSYYWSSESATPPKLVLTVPAPVLKLPLPGNERWLITQGVGGLLSHNTLLPGLGNFYYALDITPAIGGTNPITRDIPVLAAANGMVVSVGTYEFDAAGYFVKIDHDGDGNVNTGVQSSYQHMKRIPLVKTGVWVEQGDQLGVMGDTGNVTGHHLHFELRYQNLGKRGRYSGDNPMVESLLVEDKLLKEYIVLSTYLSSQQLMSY